MGGKGEYSWRMGFVETLFFFLWQSITILQNNTIYL